MLKKIEKIALFVSKHKIMITSIILLVVIIIYGNFNPYSENIFPKCSFYVLTGYKCPGCGSQRAIYDLLHLKIIEALKENLLLVTVIPYLLFGIFFETLAQKKIQFGKIYHLLFGVTAIWILFFFIIFYWFFRNTNIYYRLLNNL